MSPRKRLIGSSPDSPTLSGFPVFVARLPPAPLSSLDGSSVSILICIQSNRFLVRNTLAKFRGIRIRPTEERNQQGETRNRFCRSASALEIETRPARCQRCLGEAIHGDRQDWLRTLVGDYHLSRSDGSDY